MNNSKFNENFLFERQSPVDCSILKFVSFYLAIIFIIGVVSNTLFIWIVCSNKHLRTNLNIFIITLCAINLAATLSETPFVFLSNFKCR